MICPGCGDAIREFALYRWEEQGDGQDRVRKENDHAMDEIRYFAATVAEGKGGGVYAGCVDSFLMSSVSPGTMKSSRELRSI